MAIFKRTHYFALPVLIVTGALVVSSTGGLAIKLKEGKSTQSSTGGIGDLVYKSESDSEKSFGKVCSRFSLDLMSHEQ